MAGLAAAAREADATRLVGAACLIDRARFEIADRLAAHLDLIGLNEYFGWGRTRFPRPRDAALAIGADKPVVITETGADALAGYRGSPATLFTEECQARIYREQIRMLADAPYVRGLCPWLLYDFRSERRQTRFQRGFNRKGLIAEDKRTRKLAFAVLAAHYAKQAAEDCPS